MPEEYAYLIDENNKVIGKATKKEVIKKNLLHRGTTIYIFNSKGEILVTQRARKKMLFPGLFEIGQGGSMIYGEGYEEGARRELEEETGIKNPKLEFLFDFFYKGDKVSFFAKTYRCVYDGKIRMQKEEVEDYFFVSIDKLKKMIEDNPEKFSPDSLAQFKEYLRLNK